MKIDETDWRILAELQRDGSLTNVELARRVHLSPSPCLARVKALQAAGVIRQYVRWLNLWVSIAMTEENYNSEDSLCRLLLLIARALSIGQPQSKTGRRIFSFL